MTPVRAWRRSQDAPPAPHSLNEADHAPWLREYDEACWLAEARDAGYAAGYAAGRADALNAERACSGLGRGDHAALRWLRGVLPW